MPRIKSFNGILPAKEHAEKVIAAPPGFPLGKEALKELEENPCSFLHLVAPMPGKVYLQGSREAIVYKKAADNLHDFLEKGYLQMDQQEAFYLYEVEAESHRQTGLWAVTLFDDYLNNRVKKHEYTRIEREAGIADYLRQTGIDANPVLIAYPRQEKIEKIIQHYLRRRAILAIEKNGKTHRLYRIDRREDIGALIAHFEALPAAYLADGHHRAAAFSSYGVERRKFDFKHSGKEEYNYFSSIYFPADSLEIKAFHRLLRDLNHLTATDFLQHLSERFQLRSVERSPDLEPGTFGMYLAGAWYLLSGLSRPLAATGATQTVEPDETIPGHKAGDDPVQQLDVTLLQQQVLEPILGIKDPRSDERIRFAGADEPLELLEKEVDRGEAAVLFTQYPTAITQLMAVADAGEVMPPKSTWFEPKLDLGILTHFIP